MPAMRKARSLESTECARPGKRVQTLGYSLLFNTPPPSLPHPTIAENELDALDGGADKRALLAGLAEALFDGRYVVLGNVLADGHVLKLDAVALNRHNLARHATVLARAARLLLVHVVKLGRAGDGLAERHLGLPNNGRTLVLAQHALAVHIQMQLTHSRDDGLARLLIIANSERRVLQKGELEQLEPRACQPLPPSPNPASTCFWKRLMALLNDSRSFCFSGLMASEMTGSGTNMDVSEYLTEPSVNESPDAQSMPKSAQISPACTSSTSTISSACIRTSRGTFNNVC